MVLLTNPTIMALWHDAVRHGENRCYLTLNEEVEVYLTGLLIRYVDKPETIKRIVAIAFLEALQSNTTERLASLQSVGDQCLLFAGLFPQVAKRKHVTIRYFVDIGQSAYSTISQTKNDLYDKLAEQFVTLMDVLQSICPSNALLPLEAYEQWNEVGSQRALRILKEYTGATPLKYIK